MEVIRIGLGTEGMLEDAGHSTKGVDPRWSLRLIDQGICHLFFARWKGDQVYCHTIKWKEFFSNGI